MQEALSFGPWLKKQRRTLDLTQEELAQRAACSLSTLRKLEAGDLLPSKELAQAFAVALGLPAHEHDAFVAFARGVKTSFEPPRPAASSASAPSPHPVVDAPKTETRHYHLPAPLTELVGREREVQSGCALLRRTHVRLMTLIGPPGVGKTRLSLALAKALQADFAQGACFVPLAPINDPALVLSAIAQALQIREISGQPLLLTLQEALRPLQLLLVLDNFEQIVEAAPQISELLAAAPALKVLVSSRELLKLYGEYEFPVGPLAVPDIQHLPSADLLEMYPAVELFMQRAQAARTDFTITRENGAAVAQICAWLDGLPLAIEMAAARIKWQNPTLLLDQLRRQLMALTGGPRNLTPRQQTLRGAMDWSYNLLTPVEQQLFVALGVVNGSCTAAVAAALTGLEPALCDALLRGLVEKSLLQFSIDQQADLRYTMLQMVREYAQAKQLEQGTLAQLQARHAAIFHRLVETSQSQRQTAVRENVLNALTLEHNNLRSALTWYLQTDPASGLQLATRLATSLWNIRGYFSEGRGWLEKFLAAMPQATNPLADDVTDLATLTEAWLAAARLALGQGDLPAATTFATESERLAVRLEADSAVRAALGCRAAIALHQSDYGQATRLYQQALDLCHLETDQQEAAMLLNGLGLIAKDQGDYARARTLHERSYAIYARLSDTIGIARTLTFSAIAAYWQGDYPHCIDLAQEVITLQTGIGDVISVSYSREVLAMALVKLERFAEGIQALEEALAVFEQVDDRSGVAVVLVDLGQAAQVQGQYRRAFTYHHSALHLALTIGDRRRCAFALEGLAMALTCLPLPITSYEEAVMLFAAAATLRTAIGAPLAAIDRPAYDECLALVATKLTPDQYAAAWQRGSEARLEQLLAITLPSSP